MNLLAPLYRAADRIRWRVHRNLGHKGEDQAHRWLRCHGFTVVARNWRPPHGGGEIDLVSWEGETLVFVEVKTRSADSPVSPERAVQDDKRHALRRTARDYVMRSGADPSKVRFDVISISGDTLEHLSGAFSFDASL